MAAIDSFEAARGLAESELRALLAEGRPEERVWAIWALALRSANNVDDIAKRTEPDPGVRRNLAVVLAGHGHLDLLVALGKRDPAPEVRAAAMQLISRFALDGKLPSGLVVERATTDEPEVKIAVMGTLFAGAPRWLVELGEQLLGDRDADVRYEAFEALLRAGDVAPALVWLEEAPEGEARLVLMKWSARGRGRACADALAKASRRLRRLLIESVRVATWAELAPAIGDEPALIRALARRDPDVFHAMPIDVLVRAALREPSEAWLVMIGERLAHLDEPSQVSALLPALAERCTRCLAELDARLAEVRNARDLEAIDALEDARLAIEATLDQVGRLTVH